VKQHETTRQHNIKQHNIKQHNIKQHNIKQHDTQPTFEGTAVLPVLSFMLAKIRYESPLPAGLKNFTSDADLVEIC
jgi:hypothetical protein